MIHIEITISIQTSLDLTFSSLVFLPLTGKTLRALRCVDAPRCAGEDAKAVNFSCILALPGRRALYMVNLLKGDPKPLGNGQRVGLEQTTYEKNFYGHVT